MLMTEMEEMREVLRTAFDETESYEACPELAAAILYALSYWAGLFELKPLETRPHVIQLLKDVFSEDHIFWTMIEIGKEGEDAE